MSRLTKHDVERLLAGLEPPPPTIGSEVAGLRAALASALTVVLGTEGSFADLVEAAAVVGGWDDARAAALLSEDPVTARDALWDLAAELNEQRDILPAPPAGRSQREAVSAIERGIAALAAGDAAAVRRAASALAELDRRSLYPNLPAAFGAAADELDAGRPLPDPVVRSIADALGPGPLAAEALRRLA